LGDPLQKRNYYRAGWLRFSDDADMTSVMSDLSETKVDVICIRFIYFRIESVCQIEGFKLHVTHNIRPFINRVRYTPEVASKPDRLEKDLEQAKVLASILEAEAATLRKAKVKKLQPKDTHMAEDGREAKKEEAASTDMIDEDIIEEDDPEPKENGSDAVERRIEKVMTDLREQGHVDANDEKAYEARKVW
jgi:hypothetical protein